VKNTITCSLKNSLHDITEEALLYTKFSNRLT